ncbi:MAG: leucine-rich repeat domain-containing protein [Anaerolineae bacterium]|nr:leucine-rich repeat domain-containing protein [Anaerolineae bacterium]
MEYDELLALIGQAAKEEWKELDLSNQGITNLPPEIECLVALEKLNLGYDFDKLGKRNGLTTLPSEIGQLTNLRSLDLSLNQISTLPPEIGYLTNLQYLNLSGDPLLAIPSTPPIGQRTSSHYIRLRFNRLTSLPSEIGKLVKLQDLKLDHNELTELPPEIGQLISLQHLNLSDNRLTTLPPEIGQLTNLKYLNLSSNQFATLPLELKQLTSLTYLDLSKNSAIPLPLEILKKTDEAQAIIRAYLDYLAGQNRPLNEIKLVLVGEGSVGKTSLANRLLYDTFDSKSEKTEGIVIHRWEIASKRTSEKVGERKDGVTIRVNIWDFGGQEIMHATHQFFLTKRTLYILVLDSRYSEAENRLDYWLTLIRSFGDDSPILVVGNKTDQHPLDLDRRGLLAKHPTVQAIRDTSCATGDGIAALRSAIVQHIGLMPHVTDPLVTTWFDVKAELEALDEDYIPYSRYVELCREKNVDHPDSQRVLLGFLHDLGVVFHFPDPRLETTNILNPEWVTQGVYRILNTRLPFEEQGILTWDMLASILNDEPYREKRMFIVDMMQKFELCYELPDRKDTFLIPDLLPKEAPDTGVWSDALAFEVHYPVLPGSILTRLIVRMHRHIKERIVWRTGVLLACDGNEALVRADLVANRLTIAVRGPGVGRRELLTRIREHLEAIHGSLVGLQPAEKVPVPGHPKIPPVDYRWLRKLEQRGHQEFIPPGLEDPISVRQLLDGVEPPEARWKREGRGGDVYNIYNSQIGVAGRKATVDDGVHFNKT